MRYGAPFRYRLGRGVAVTRVGQPHNWQRTEPLRNPEGTLVLLIRNELAHAQRVTVRLQQHDLGLELPPDSIPTLSLRKNLNNHRVSRIGHTCMPKSNRRC